MTMPNLFEPEWDDERSRPGFACRRSKLGAQAGGERLGASLYELEPGEAICPYHAHFANEEMLVVVSGRPSLRTKAGWRELERGEIVAFPRGKRGAHQVANRDSEPAGRILLISEMNYPEVALYPDSNKVLAATRAPGGAGGDEDIFEIFPRDSAADYWYGEEPPEAG
jgi:uncharacterized cupin superfamily protein